MPSFTTRCVALGACLLAAAAIVSCESIPGKPYIEPHYDPDGEPDGIKFGWSIPFRTVDVNTGDGTLILTTRPATPTTREFVLTCSGGPGDSLEWTASSANEAISQLDDIADATYMVLPSNAVERAELLDDIEDWINSEWMSPDAYHTLTGR